MPWSEKRNRYYPTIIEEPARFWIRVDGSAGDDACWPWLGARDPKGYGQAGKRWRAHRVAMFLTNGPIPPGMFVCHHCDNPPCCNPAHLFIGTVTDNMRDCAAKGRTSRKGGIGRLGKRPTHCKYGHEFTPENTITRPSRSGRECRICNRELCRARRRAKAGAP